MKYKVEFGVRSGTTSNGDTIVSSYAEARKLANNLVRVFSNDPSCTEFTDLSRTIMLLDWRNKDYFVTIWPLGGDKVNDVTGSSKLDDIESLLPVYEKQPDQFLLVTDKILSACLARIVLKGDVYDGNGCLLKWEGEPRVELYDLSYDCQIPWLGITGLLVTDHNIDELLEHNPLEALYMEMEDYEEYFSKKQAKKIIKWLINWRKGE